MNDMMGGERNYPISLSSIAIVQEQYLNVVFNIINICGRVFHFIIENEM